MLLQLYSHALYLNEEHSFSTVRGHFFLGNQI